MFLSDRPDRLFLSVLAPLLFLIGLAGEAQAEAAANVVFATGAARIVAADGSIRAAARGTAVQAGEMVDTQDGRAQLRFSDGAAISLQPGTQFRVEQYRFVEQDGRAGEDDMVVMRFLKGTLRAISGLIGRQKREQYRMDTTVGTIGIRGTEYGAALGDGGLSVTTYAGLVEVCNDAGCALVAPGQTLVVPGNNVKPQLKGAAEPLELPRGAAVPQLPPVQPSAPVVPQQMPVVPQQMPVAPQQMPVTAPPATSPTYGPNY